MNKRLLLLSIAFLLISLPICSNQPNFKNLVVVQGIVLEKWELNRWQIEDDYTSFEGYSRLKIVAERPSHLRGQIFTIYYNKWNVPKSIIPSRKGIRCAFAVPVGTLSSKAIIWPMIKFFWLIPEHSHLYVLPPPGKVADSL